MIPENDDFKSMLDDLGVTEEFVSTQSQFMGDRVDIPEDGFSLGGSIIHGVGVFATREFQSGEVIGVGNLRGRRTQLGRYTNHSHKPNAITSWLNDDIVLMASRSVTTNDEITVDYRQTRTLAMRGPRP